MDNDLLKLTQNQNSVTRGLQFEETVGLYGCVVGQVKQCYLST